MDKINQRIATELGVGPGQVAAAVELLGEGVDGPVHRPLPQGEDRRPRRHAAAQAGGAARLPARAGGSPRHRAQDHRRAGQADARAGARHQRRGDQGRAGRPLRALQAEAAHQGADRARGRPRAAERSAARRTRRSTRGGSRQVHRRRQGRRRRQGGARRRAPHPHRAHRRDADAGRRLARMAVERRRAEVGGEARARPSEGAKFSDYFDFGQRIKDMPSHRALAMLRGTNEGILDLDLDVAHEAGKPHPAEGTIKAAFGIADRGRPADAWLGETVRLAWKDKLARLAADGPADAPQGARRRRGHRRLLAQPEGSAAGGTGRPARHHGPRPRHPHRRQGRRRRSDRQGRRHDDDLSARAAGAIGRARSPRWPRCASSTRSTSSASATAPAGARPTSSSPS